MTMTDGRTPPAKEQTRPGWRRVWFLLILPPILLMTLTTAYGVYLVFAAHGDRSVLNTQLPAGVIYVVLVNHSILFLLLLWFLRLDRMTLADIGWRAPNGIMRELVIGAVAGAAIYAVHQYVFTPYAAELFAGKSDFRLASHSTPLGTNLVLSLIAGVLGGGVVEESLFRGYALARLRERMSIWLAVPAMLFFFCILHFGLGLSGMLVATATGFLLTMLYLQRGSLIAPAIAHALVNVLVLAL